MLIRSLTEIKKDAFISTCESELKIKETCIIVSKIELGSRTKMVEWSCNLDIIKFGVFAIVSPLYRKKISLPILFSSKPTVFKYISKRSEKEIFLLAFIILLNPKEELKSTLIMFFSYSFIFNIFPI